MLRNPFTKHKPTSPPDPTYADMFEIMRYDRGMDVMPYAIAYRLTPPFVDPTGPEPSFALLDTEAEIDAFMDVLHSPIVFEPSGKPAWPPLQQWHETPRPLCIIRTQIHGSGLVSSGMRPLWSRLRRSDQT